MNVKLLAHTDEILADLAARTCTSGNIPNSDKSSKKAMIRAMASGHDSILEHVTFTFMIEGISRITSHQLVRHRFMSFSQQSQRYVDSRNASVTIPASIRDRGFLPDFDKQLSDSMDLYQKMVDSGVPTEDARYILPGAACSNIMLTANARELLHFFDLRCCNRAQWEIRELSEEMLRLCVETCPTIFSGAGPSCVHHGRCPEAKPCGRDVL